MNETVEAGGQEKNLKRYNSPQGMVLRWLKEIDLVLNSKSQKAYERIGEKIVKTYRNADCLNYNNSDNSTSRVMFNVLWSNVQVMKPALYSRLPKVVCERIHKDSDPIGRLAAEMSERATHYSLMCQQDRANFAFKAAVEDRLLPGRGQVWLRLDTEMEDEVDANGEPVVDEEGNPIKKVKPYSEKIYVDYVFWQDYLESTSRNPYEVRWRAKRAYMTRAQLIKRFGAIGKEVELDTDSKKKNKISEEDAEFLAQAEVWEIEDIESKQRLWVCKGYREAPLEVKPDVLKLSGFWSSPVPLLATTTTDSSYPTPDFKIYEKLADELDYVTKRISSIVDTIRVVGMAAASLYSDLKNMLKLGDGEIVKVEQWAAFMEKGGLANGINWYPFDNAIAALQPLTQYQQSILGQIFEITGIPDIARGLTDPGETLGAQKLKIRSLGTKAEERARDVQRFCREVVAKMAEIIFEPGLFSDDTIYQMCGVAQMSPENQELAPKALALLRDDRLRTFRIDIETDSTIASDEEGDKAARMEYIGAMNQLLSNLQQVQSFRPELMQPAIESVLFAVRSFRTGRPLEGAWEKALQDIEEADKQARENPQPPPPDPAMAKVEIEGQRLQLDSQKMQMEGDFKYQEMELKNRAQMFDEYIKGEQLKIDGSKSMSEAQIKAMDMELKKFKEDFAQFVQVKTLEMEQYRVVLDQKEKFLEEARLKQANELEMVRMAHEQQLASKEAAVLMAAEGKAAEKEKEPKEKTQKPPDIHVHIGGGKKRITKKSGANGEATYESEDVD